jgi:hypothetical protein
MSDTEHLLLHPGSWYAWYMLPGYSTGFFPYVSPIKVYDVKPEKTGRSTLLLSFYNAGYAEGVRDFKLRIRILTRRDHHLLVELLYGSGGAVDRRDAVIGRIDHEWLAAHIRTVEGVPRPGPDAPRSEIDGYIDRVDRALNTW